MSAAPGKVILPIFGLAEFSHSQGHERRPWVSVVRRTMSAMPPTATELLRRRDPPLRARSRPDDRRYTSSSRSPHDCRTVGD